MSSLLRQSLRAQTTALLRDHLGAFLNTVESVDFCRPCCVIGGTAGQHARHINDHFVRLADTLEEHCESRKVVRYDVRARETAFETDVLAARIGVANTLARMDSILASDIDLSSIIDVSFMLVGEEQKMRSTVARECSFVVHHAFHHTASIKVIAKNLGFEHACPDGFGIAPSTADYRAQARCRQ